MQMSLLLFVNMGLLIFAFFCVRRKASLTHWREIVKQVAILEMVWATFSFMFGLFILFHVLESVTKDSSFMKTAGGFNLVILIISFGFGMLHLLVSSLLIYKVFRNTSR